MDHFTDIQAFQHFDKYSRVVDGKRTNYIETVTETVDFLFNYFRIKDDELKTFFYSAIGNMDIFPSLRLLNQTPEAIARDNTVVYNCSALNANSWHAIASVLYLSMSGVGVGIGVENRVVKTLPTIRPMVDGLSEILVVEDSQFGWATSYWQFLDLYSNGVNVLVDISKIRPEGAILKTKNGIASGPKPFEDLLNFTKRIIDGARGRKLTVTEVADITTFIGNVAVSGGARRSALILLGDADDEFVNLKYDGFYKKHPWRANANNSIITEQYNSQNEIDKLLYAFTSSTAEPGFYSRYSALATSPDRRHSELAFLTNPCGEINLRPDEFCNLTQVNMRNDWTVSKFYRMVEAATILGTIQSMFDTFSFISNNFRQNAIEERLLGVGLSNIFAALQFANPIILQNAKKVAIETNRKWADYFGIERSAAITTIKPSGNSSVLGNLASPGLHPSFGDYTRRNIAIEVFTPMGKFLKEKNWPMREHPYKPNSYLAQFYETARGVPSAKDVSAIQHLDMWLLYKKNWAEHNVSCSIYYSNDEVPAIKKWIFDNQLFVNGITFMPRQDYDFPFAPIESITQAEYEKSIALQPKVNWDEYKTFDVEHHRQKQIVECSGDSCVLVYE